jgi:hypothetical protein
MARKDETHLAPTYRCGTQVTKGRQQGAPVGRKLPPVLIHKNGCQPKRMTRRNSHGAYKPRPASTITVQPAGMASRSRRHRVDAPQGQHGGLGLAQKGLMLHDERQLHGALLGAGETLGHVPQEQAASLTTCSTARRQSARRSG